MVVSSSSFRTSSEIKQLSFERRSLLPLRDRELWRIERGVIRTFTWLEDGTCITFGVWGPGDIVGRALSKADPYQIECLTDVRVSSLPTSQLSEVTDALLLHIQRLGEFLEIVNCKRIDVSLLRLIEWLGKRFGREIDEGKLVDLRLTHQEMAEIIGSTRVSVTRLLKDFEQQGIIKRGHHQFVILQDQNPFWHYEI